MQQHHVGLTLLEMLLVLVVVAGITILAMRGYRQAQYHLRIKQVQQDQHTILQALNSYYHRVGCAASGVFPVGKRHPSWLELGLAATQQQHLPMVTNYSVAIVDNGTATKDQPLYALQVTATLAHSIAKSQVQWLAQALDVKDVSGHLLTWRTPPNNSAAKPGHAFWGISASGAQFKWQEIKKAGATGTSPSYCAN